MISLISLARPKPDQVVRRYTDWLAENRKVHVSGQAVYFTVGGIDLVGRFYALPLKWISKGGRGASLTPF